MIRVYTKRTQIRLDCIISCYYLKTETTKLVQTNDPTTHWDLSCALILNRSMVNPLYNSGTKMQKRFSIKLTRELLMYITMEMLL